MSWWRGTRRGSAVSSAGAKKAVTLAMNRLMPRISGTLAVALSAPTKMNRIVPPARRMLLASMMIRASARSTMTPAMALKMTAGTRNVRIRSALAVFEPVAP